MNDISINGKEVFYICERMSEEQFNNFKRSYREEGIKSAIFFVKEPNNKNASKSNTIKNSSSHFRTEAANR